MQRRGFPCSPTAQVLQPLVSGILHVTAHFLNKTQFSEANSSIFSLGNKKADEMKPSVTLTTACESVREPSAGPSWPVRIILLVSVSEAAMIYLQNNQIYSLFSQF